MNLIEMIQAYNDRVIALKNNANLTEEEVIKELEDLKELKNSITVEKERQSIEIEEFKALEDTLKTGGNEDMKIYNNTILAKLLQGKATEEDKTIYNAYKGQQEKVKTDGGYLVPEEQLMALYEYKRTLPSLEQYVNVINVTSPFGTLPMEVTNSDKLFEIGEANDITLSEHKFAEIKYDVKKYAVILRATSEILNDNTANLMDYLNRNIAKRSIRTTTAKIVAKLKEVAGVTEGKNATAVDTLLKAYYKLDPIFRNGGVIVTNTDGLQLLDSLKNADGTPVLTRTYTDKEVIKFKGLEVLEVTNTELETTANKVPFYMGSLSEYLTKVDLKQLEIAVSKEAGFINDTTYIRGIERWDIIKVDGEAMQAVNIDTVTK